MSRTPAAEAARLRLTYPLWLIERASDGLRETGWRALRLGYSAAVGAPTTGALEIMIGSFETDLATGRIPRNGARATGARVP